MTHALFYLAPRLASDDEIDTPGMIDLAGVPRSEILRISELLATKLIENEFVAYIQLEKLMASEDALSKRGFTIASYALCGFANLSSLGIQMGVLTALAPSRNRLIARIGLSAMISGFISTLQAAAIACVFFFFP